ncbi:MAG: hypothetical protein QM820_63685 [Minicystis sp.]
MSCEQEQQAVDDLAALLSDLQASLEDIPPNQKSHVIAQIDATRKRLSTAQKKLQQCHAGDPPPPPPVELTLTPNQSLWSNARNARLVYQGDGDSVLYVRRNGVLPSDSESGVEARAWASGTAGTSAGRAVVQNDGNFVVYDGGGTPVWASNTNGNPGAFLALQDDENLVLYAAHGPAIWSSDTWVAHEVNSAFDPAVRGFHFTNNFPDGSWTIGALHFSTNGLCGGMSFTALDYFHANRAVPTTSAVPSAVGDPLGGYINARQQESVMTNLSSWMTQVLNPDDHALEFWSTHDEWVKLKAAIDAGQPVPIGLGVYLQGGNGHQVVACGYREGKRERWILTYDPNNRNARGYVHLRRDGLHWFTQEAGKEFRGFFVSAYTPKSPP